MREKPRVGQQCDITDDGIVLVIARRPFTAERGMHVHIRLLHVRLPIVRVEHDRVAVVALAHKVEIRVVGFPADNEVTPAVDIREEADNVVVVQHPANLAVERLHIDLPVSGLGAFGLLFQFDKEQQAVPDTAADQGGRIIGKRTVEAKRYLVLVRNNVLPRRCLVQVGALGNARIQCDAREMAFQQGFGQPSVGNARETVQVVANRIAHIGSRVEDIRDRAANINPAVLRRARLHAGGAKRIPVIAHTLVVDRHDAAVSENDMVLAVP